MRASLFFVSALLFGCSSSSEAAVLDDAAETGEEVGDDTGSNGEDSSTSADSALTDAESDGSAPDTAMTVDAGPPAVRFVGRFTDKNEFAWTGSQVIARFNGTAARIKLDAGDNVQFQILVDGKATEVLKPTGGAKTYTVASGLSAGIHEVTVWRRSEAFFGVATYQGFEFDGTLLPPAPAPAHRIEIIGDSITCGYGDEGDGPSCPFAPETENHFLTYGAVAARSVSADLVTTCWSGMGMYRDYGGSTTDQMPVRYLRTLPESASSAWSFPKYVPQAVVINLGTNDFHGGDPGMPYRAAYLSFVRNVRKNYPSAFIFMVAPVAGSKAHIDAVIATLAGEGDTKTTAVVFSPIAAADGWGCDYHPTVASHAKMGAELAAAIKSKLGW